MNKRIRVVAAIGVVGMVFVFAACGSGSKSASESGSAENTFGLSEFQITPPTNTLNAGRVTITANNVGGEVHELVVVRAASAEALAKKTDGSVDEAQIADADKIGEIGDVAPGARRSKTLDLGAGTYVALCNIIDDMTASTSSTMDGHSMTGDSDGGADVGHGHFSEGMHVAFTVS